MWLRRLLIGLAIWQGARMVRNWIVGTRGNRSGPARRSARARVAQRRTLLRGLARAKARSRAEFRRQLARAKAQARIARRRVFGGGRDGDGVLQRLGSLLGLVR